MGCFFTMFRIVGQDALRVVDIARNRAANFLASHVMDIPRTEVFHLAISSYALSLSHLNSWTAFEHLWSWVRSSRKYFTCLSLLVARLWNGFYSHREKPRFINLAMPETHKGGSDSPLPGFRPAIDYQLLMFYCVSVISQLYV